ncbi:MAG: hypothetical protein IJ756_05325 [Paludibacteraceae bacterium]|nr:hypothetical protein [Paludibacteraceae bacterium]
MKKILFLLAISLYSLFANCNTIHWITFTDTTDPKVGEMDKVAQKYLYSKWIDKVNAALAEKCYKSKIYKFDGEDTKPEQCKEIITNLKCEKEDIVVFYYIGHGGRSIADNVKYPQLIFAQNYEEMCIPLMWVANELQKKNARLTLTIAMCCNSFTQGLSPKNGISFGVEKGSAEFSKNEINAIQKLFLGYRGDITMSSSSIGQPSWGYYIPQINASMDIFTYMLIKNFTEYTNDSLDPSWHILLSRIKSDVSNSTNQQRANGITMQTPQYDIIVQKTEILGCEQKRIPTPPVVEDDIIEVNKNGYVNQKMTEIFDYIINTNNSLEDRIEKSEKLKTIFAKNAVVRILGADTDIVVNKQNLSDYLDIATGSKKYYKIVIHSVSIDENKKITEIKVKEYLKK